MTALKCVSDRTGKNVFKIVYRKFAREFLLCLWDYENTTANLCAAYSWPWSPLLQSPCRRTGRNRSFCRWECIDRSGFRSGRKRPSKHTAAGPSGSKRWKACTQRKQLLFTKRYTFEWGVLDWKFHPLRFQLVASPSGATGERSTRHVT